MKQFPLRLGVMLLLVSFVCGCGLKTGKTNSDPDGSKHQNGQLVTIPGDNKIADDDKAEAEAEASELSILQKQIGQNSCGAVSYTHLIGTLSGGIDNGREAG